MHGYTPSNEILITDYAPPNVFIFSQSLVNRPNQLIRQYFTRQLVQVSIFANILPLQNFPTYGRLLNPVLLNKSGLVRAKAGNFNIKSLNRCFYQVRTWRVFAEPVTFSFNSVHSFVTILEKKLTTWLEQYLIAAEEYCLDASMYGLHMKLRKTRRGLPSITTLDQLFEKISAKLPPRTFWEKI